MPTEQKATVEVALDGGSLWFGVFAFLVGLFFLYFSKDIQQLGLASQGDPGSRALPVALSVCLLLGGVQQVLSYLWTRGKKPHRPQVASASGEGLLNVFMLTVAIAVYLATIPLLGFYAGTFLFASVVTCWLGARWWAATSAAALIVIFAWGLFVKMFKVQLTAGIFEAWF